MTLRLDKRRFTINVLTNGKVVERHDTRSLRRFLDLARLVQFKDSMKITVRIVANYGLKKDNYGKMSQFENEGVYDNQKDLVFAAKAFTEED